MKPYEPQDLPITSLDAGRLIHFVGEATNMLSLYNGLLQRIVNPSLLLGSLMTEEAVLSSRIEGTQATIDDVYEHEAGIQKTSERERDIQEIVNYRRALAYAQDYLKQRPISLFFIKAIHRELMQGVRGQDKSPGEFRNVQNWIGKPGSTMESASFVPPSPFQLQDHLEALERYILSDDVDVLIQTAVVHAQFEMLHPFKDGNGRMGRLLIPLFLFQKKRLIQPMFYLSGYLESHRDEYYLELAKVSQTGDWNDWIVFFLKAIQAQAERGLKRIQSINDLYDEMKERIGNAAHSQYAIHVLDELFVRPVFRSSQFIRELKIQKTTGTTILRNLRDAGILKEVQEGSGRRPSVLCFPDLLKLVGNY